LVRSINSDHHHAGKQLIRVRMSENQFAQFITSLNIGLGTPCTIERMDNKQVSDPPYRNEVEIVKDTFEKKAQEVAAHLEEARIQLAEMLKPNAKATKAALTDLREEIEAASREIRANMPYMAECFVETMEDVVTAAKHDIESYMTDAAARAGVPGLSTPVTLQIESSTPATVDEEQAAAEMLEKD
jgi:ElaB/YqjD/DUF883 family membrane-anchored ribosome-binding protein